MASWLQSRKNRQLSQAPELGSVLGGIADDIRLAIGVVDSALRAEFDMIEGVRALIIREQPNVQIPDGAPSSKDPHCRIRHDHGLLCIEAPRLARELDCLAQSLFLPSAPELSVPAFRLRAPRSRASRIVDAEASLAAIVCEARRCDWTPFEDGSASVHSVALMLTGSDERIGKALLALFAMDVAPVRRAIRALSEVTHVSGSRLWAIAKRVEASAGERDVQSVIVPLRSLAEALHELDARIRKTCLLDPTPRGRHSRDIAYEEVVSALADADFDTAKIARLIVPTSEREDCRIWTKRVRDHLRTADRRGLGVVVHSWGTSLELRVPSRFKRFRYLN